jgi:hypothetical protein
MVYYISGTLGFQQLAPSSQRRLGVADCEQLLEWLESQLQQLDSYVENYDSIHPALHMIRVLYQDVRRALSDEQPFILVLDARFDGRSTEPFYVKAQVQLPQLPDQTTN